MFENRAVSDAIAFVLAFSMIILSVGVVYTFGFDAVTDIRDSEQLSNAERTFLTMERNFDDIRRREAPERSAEMNLNGGTIRIRRSSTINVTVGWVNRTSGATGTFTKALTVGALSYEYRNRFIEYANGAVFRRSREASVMLSEPSLRCIDSDADGTPDYAVVSIVTIEGAQGSIGGDRIVTINARRETSNLLFPNDRDRSGVNVTVAFGGPNDPGWNRYLRDAAGWSETSPGRFTCSAPGGLDQVFVRRTILNITLGAEAT